MRGRGVVNEDLLVNRLSLTITALPGRLCENLYKFRFGWTQAHGVSQGVESMSVTDS